MFTIKHRTYNPAGELNDGSYFANETVHGPFRFTSQEWTKDGMVVHGYYDDGLPMTFGPTLSGVPNIPSPEVWVMNEAGATVAHYRL